MIYIYLFFRVYPYYALMINVSMHILNFFFEEPLIKSQTRLFDEIIVIVKYMP